ncbi:hypothetical protein HNR23_000189 [Nocardiopsis mwathae]|uniref:Uncharacterized protein n=1 Tax=Nocardiopsis mwathae TaxID=1472723 RepID=A0A7W9YDL5_9ACTN|nr:hypothetical protein [Nocardiopsis mwathae]MBB6170129.1 hypothetical protein [Nocardiopsis mwathae]
MDADGLPLQGIGSPDPSGGEVQPSPPDMLAEPVHNHTRCWRCGADLEADPVTRRLAEREGLEQIVAAYEAEHGPLSEEDVARAQAVFDAAERREAEWQSRQKRKLGGGGLD